MYHETLSFATTGKQIDATHEAKWLALCAATASMAIHQAEMSDIVRKALSEESLDEQEGAVVPLPA